MYRSYKGLPISWFRKYGTWIRYLSNEVVKPIFFFSIESLTFTKTDCLTITQRIKIIKTCYKNGDSAPATYCAVRGDYGLHNRLSNYAGNWQNCEEICWDWSGYKFGMPCASSFRSFYWKYCYCNWKSWRRPEIRTILRQIIAYFAQISTPTSI